MKDVTANARKLILVLSFVLKDTTINGGTFNDVSGDLNMTQISNVHHVVHIHPPAARRLEEAADGSQAPPQIEASIVSASRVCNPADGVIGASLPFENLNLIISISTAHHWHDSTANGWKCIAFWSASAAFHRHTVTIFAGVPNDNSPDNHEVILPVANRGEPPHPTNTAPPAIGYEFEGNQRIFSATEHARPQTTSNDGARTHPENGWNTFKSVGGNVTQLSVTSYGESVVEALHDSADRFPEPACHPGTRIAVLEQLQSWSNDTDPESTVLWLHGSAGVGKSAIAQMFAGDCQAQGRLGASFFFRRGDPKRGSWNRLFTTIAYQLATSVPELLLPIQQAAESDKLVAGRAITVQFQRLFAAPLQSTPIIVLDGLDECADHKVQQQILRLFITAIRDYQLPIRLLIASRHEPHIREKLETEEAFAICRHFVLSADEVAYDDIRTYLYQEFSRIRAERTARGINLGAWPPLGAAEKLVIRSSGIFIYATTVIRFIDDEYSHPMDRLDAVLNLDPCSTAPLDDLYTEILSVVPPEPRQLRILHAIWEGTLDGYLAMDPEELDLLFFLALAPDSQKGIGLGPRTHPSVTILGTQDDRVDVTAVPSLLATFNGYRMSSTGKPALQRSARRCSEYWCCLRCGGAGRSGVRRAM
ncbi:hypothetical protein B0H13DRAFT_2679481 [Mycena leptocephala]|nr:hypothetical protein B0H13DRAFT_2679481 [Mycena leptocephala]